jgi:hypothetical protein
MSDYRRCSLSPPATGLRQRCRSRPRGQTSSTTSSQSALVRTRTRGPPRATCSRYVFFSLSLCNIQCYFVHLRVSSFSLSLSVFLQHPFVRKGESLGTAVLQRLAQRFFDFQSKKKAEKEKKVLFLASILRVRFYDIVSYSCARMISFLS